MGENFPLLLVLLAFIAIFMREDFVLTLIYLFVGAFALGRWWSRHTLSAVTFKRTFMTRAFLGENVPIRLELVNTSWLPLVWLQFDETLPIELAVPNLYRRVVTLGSKGRAQFDYTLHASKRGYYRVGPLHLRSGDLIGLSDNLIDEGQSEALIVYPRIVSLTRVKLPSRSPLGTLRHTEPIFEDPSRIFGKRDYVAGDSLRRVDWKATASIGRLQVKQFEPSMALETAIFLNLNKEEYEYRAQIDATELAIVIAASIANWIIMQRQAVGLSVNGEDPLGADGQPQSLPPRKGRAHLTRVLDVLARIRTARTQPFVQLFQQENTHLPWGTTSILIMGHLDEALFNEIFRARRAGVNVVVILVGKVPAIEAIRRRGQHFGLTIHEIYDERDLARWRQ